MLKRIMFVAVILVGLAGYATHKTSQFNTNVEVVTTLIGCDTSLLGVPSFRYCEYKGGGVAGEFSVSKLEFEYNKNLIGKPYVMTLPHPRRWLFFTFLSIWLISMLTVAIGYVVAKPDQDHYPE